MKKGIDEGLQQGGERPRKKNCPVVKNFPQEKRGDYRSHWHTKKTAQTAGLTGVGRCRLQK